MNNYHSFNTLTNGIMSSNNSNTPLTSVLQNETNSNNNNNNDNDNQVTINMWENNNVTNNNINSNNNNNNNNNILENDDFDSDQLDEDESYSWASGITDNQDGMGSNGHAGGTLIGCTGSNTGGCSSSIANWRDWRSNNMSNDLLMNMGVMNRITTNNFTINNSFNAPNLIPITHVTSQKQMTVNSNTSYTIPSLVDLCARYVAFNLPFELVESFKQPVPEDLQLKITYSSFPDNIENIRLYSCLANGCVDEYIRGEQLYHNRCVRKIMQIGFHLSAQVVISSPLGINGNTNNNNSNNNSNNAAASLFLQNNYKNTNNLSIIGNGASSLFTSVAIVCDRKRIISCHCTCSKQSIPWCSHIVAVCLFRILEADSVEYRAPVSESLSKLHRDQLQKFAQYLISELPQQILPTAQRLLDELLKGNDSSMNLMSGAPDPTAGASQNDISVWCLDEVILQENIHKTLVKFILPTPNVVSDIECLEHASSATAAEYTSLLRPLRGREPEGMWNLVSIVREMFKRRDKNSIPLLKLITYECVNMDQILQLWFLVKSSQLNHDKMLFNSVTHHSLNGSNQRNNNNNLTHTPPVYQACASLMDEIVTLWRIACLNPLLINVNDEKLTYHDQLLKWHQLTIEKLRKFCNSIINNHNNSNHNIWSSQVVSASTNNTSNSGEKLLKRLESDQFDGFMTAVNACRIKWNDFDFESTGLFRQQCLTQIELAALNMTSANLNAADVKQTFISNDQDPDSSEQEPIVFSEAKLKNSNNEKSNLLNFKLKMFNSSINNTLNSNSHLMQLSEENTIEIMFSRCEALYLHGFEEHACILAELLAEHLINSTNIISLFNHDEKAYDLNEPTEEIPQSSQQSSSKTASTTSTTFVKSKLNRASQHSKHKYVNKFHETILWRSYLLSNILYESSLKVTAQTSKLTSRKKKSLNNLSFRIGIFGLDTPRMPAVSKALEVKLINQEQEMVNLLKRLKCGSFELNLLTERAIKLKDCGVAYNQAQRHNYPNNYQALPVMLASFIFDTFQAQDKVASVLLGEQTIETSEQTAKLVEQQNLGFEAAVAVLGMKANVSESQHSLLCEGIRRQKGDLALTLLLAYKDDEQRLLKIMDKLLDRDVYALFKNNTSVVMMNPFNPNLKKIQQQQQQDFIQLGLIPQTTPTAGCNTNSTSNPTTSSITTESKLTLNDKESQLAYELSQFQIKLLSSPGTASATFGKSLTSISQVKSAAAIDSLSSGWEESENESPNLSNDVSLLETKHRCMNLKQQLQPNANSSANYSQLVKDTTSSDNSPTSNRKHHILPQVPSSSSKVNTLTKLDTVESKSKNKLATAYSAVDDSGDDSGESSSSSQDNTKLHSIDTPEPTKKSEFQEVSASTSNEQLVVKPIPQTITLNPTKTSSRQMTSNIRQPNQPSEALAHFMFEFSKQVLSKAGGSISTSVFLNQPTNQPGGGPHRNLHICSFLISLYALGLHNCVQPTWLTRTYSSHVTWINSQAADLGYAAICILIECWQGRLTPSECVALADRVSRVRDNMAVKAAAELALSSLKFANFMSLTEIQRALIQCKEQSTEMLQRACIIVENSVRDANSTNLLEILFTVAKRWDELFVESVRSTGNQRQSTVSNIEPSPGVELPFANSLLNQNLFELINQNTNTNFPIEALNSIIQQQQQQLNNNNNNNNSNNNSFTQPNHGNFYPLYMQPSQIIQGSQLNNNISAPFATPTGNNGTIQNNQTNCFNPSSYLNNNNANSFQQVPSSSNNNFNSNVFFNPNSTNIYQFNNNNNNANNIQNNNNNTANNIHNTMSYQQQQQINYQQNYFMQQQQQHQQPPQQPTQPINFHSLEAIDETAMKHLNAAFRVGMLGLEALPRRVDGQIKYRQSPLYADDVKWLWEVSIKLDSYLKSTNSLQQFCQTAATVIQNPFLLQDIAFDSAHYLSRNNPTHFSMILCSPMLSILVQRCLNLYLRCCTSKLHHISPSEHDDFINMIITARNLFYYSGNMNCFSDLVQNLRRSNRCKKELWTKICNALNNTSYNL